VICTAKPPAIGIGVPKVETRAGLFAAAGVAKPTANRIAEAMEINLWMPRIATPKKVLAKTLVQHVRTSPKMFG
jgi:hypothetical protein